jgi:hypothetical protein
MKWLDVPVILFSLLAGAAGILFSMSFPAAGTVLIRTPDAVFRYPIDRDREVKVLGKLGDYLVEIKNGKVRAREAGCPGRICVQRGWIYRSGDSIICFPNQIIIRLENGGQKEDAITE